MRSFSFFKTVTIFRTFCELVYREFLIRFCNADGVLDVHCNFESSFKKLKKEKVFRF